MFEILKKREMADGSVVLNEISAPLIAEKAKPGQFVILKANETGERIPLTIAYSYPERGIIAVIYQVVGKSTALFKTMQVGEGFQDVIGPLGKPTDIEKVGNVICVGGGTGVAVMYPITKAMKEAGNHVFSVIGARTKDLLILEEEMKNASHELHVCTDDGSYGHHGFVTDKVKELIENYDIRQVVAIGPVPMMKFVCKITEEKNIKTLVSLNSIMVDGTGMCGCCRITVGGKTRFACVEGPEFDGHQVDFQELNTRLQAYTQQEKEAYEKFKCACQTG
ncbi:MAG: sulfide/dihydroorotate dehydrogenase-like FAD/NAD-binding protein [Thermodesulfobacteriota bacterium]